MIDAIAQIGSHRPPWQCQYGQQVAGSSLVVVEAVGGGGLARHSASMRWARLIAQTLWHGHREVCGGGLLGFTVGVEEHVFVNFVVSSVCVCVGGGGWGASSAQHH